MRRIATSAVIANHLFFIAGIQVAACVELLVSNYFVDIELQQSILAILASLVLGASSYLSLVLGGQIQYVTKVGERAERTTLESEIDELMNDRLKESVPMVLCGSRKRIDKMRMLLYSDVFLSISGLVIVSLGKTVT